MTDTDTKPELSKVDAERLAVLLTSVTNNWSLTDQRAAIKYELETRDATIADLREQVASRDAQIAGLNEHAAHFASVLDETLDRATKAEAEVDRRGRFLGEALFYIGDAGSDDNPETRGHASDLYADIKAALVSPQPAAAPCNWIGGNDGAWCTVCKTEVETNEVLPPCPLATQPDAARAKTSIDELIAWHEAQRYELHANPLGKDGLHTAAQGIHLDMHRKMIDLLAAKRDAHPSAVAPQPSGWRHKKRGTTYRIVGEASSQVVGEPIGEGDTVVVYRADSDGTLWVRRKDEFYDGRFEALPAPPALDQEGEG